MAPRAQEWRNYEYGLANLACGHSKGNLTITAIEDDSFETIPYLEHVSFSFVNPFTGTAMSIGKSNFVTLKELKVAVDKYIEQGCKDRSNCAIGQQYGRPMNTWGVGHVTSMVRLFRNKNFNERIDSWDVSSVTTMSNMFDGTVSFNQEIKSWTTSKVVNMQYMFRMAGSFNQDVSQWDVTSVTNMQYMFLRASSFRQNMCAWRTASFPYAAISKGIFEYTRCIDPRKPIAMNSRFFCDSCVSVPPTVSCFILFLGLCCLCAAHDEQLIQ